MSITDAAARWQDLSGIKRKRTNLINSLLLAARTASRENHAELQQQISQAESLLGSIIDKLEVDQSSAQCLRNDSNYDTATAIEQTNNNLHSIPDENSISYHRESVQESLTEPWTEVHPDYGTTYMPLQASNNSGRPDSFHNAYTAHSLNSPHTGCPSPVSALGSHPSHSDSGMLQSGSAGQKHARAAEYEVSHPAKQPRTTLEQRSHSTYDGSTHGAGSVPENANLPPLNYNNISAPSQGRPSKKAPSKSSMPQTSGDLAPLRRPTTAPKVLSYSWDHVNLARKRRLSHFGYIEETEAGMPAPKPCTHCSNYMWGHGKDRAKLVCRVYKPDTVGNYTKAVGYNWKRCSHCWMSGRDCSLVKEAEMEDRNASSG